MNENEIYTNLKRSADADYAKLKKDLEQEYQRYLTLAQADVKNFGYLAKLLAKLRRVLRIVEKERAKSLTLEAKP